MPYLFAVSLSSDEAVMAKGIQPSTLSPQMQSCGRQTGAPILNPTAMRSTLFSRKMQKFADGIAKRPDS